jgi:hypothetical protein
MGLFDEAVLLAILGGDVDFVLELMLKDNEKTLKDANIKLVVVIKHLTFDWVVVFATSFAMACHRTIVLYIDLVLFLIAKIVWRSTLNVIGQNDQKSVSGGIVFIDSNEFFSRCIIFDFCIPIGSIPFTLVFFGLNPSICFSNSCLVIGL